MKAKIPLAISIILLLLGAANAQRSSTQLETTLLTSDPVPLQSGENGDVTFKITNEGNSVARNVSVTIRDRYPFQLVPDRQRTYSLGDVTPGEEYYISTEIRVAEDAPDGSSDLILDISEKGLDQEKKIPLEIQSEDIDLNLANLNTQPSQLMPDTEDNKLEIDVVNNGEKKAENVVLDLDLPDYFEKTSSFSSRGSLGNLKPGEAKTAEFFFDINETAPEGMTEIPSTITYSTGDETTEISQEESFEVFIAGKPQFRITNVTSDLETGRTGKIRLKVRNIGEEESESTRVRALDSSDLPISFRSSSAFVGTLQPGSEGTAVFEVTVESDSPVKNYLLDFEIRGVKGTELFTEDETVEVPVESGSTGESDLPVAPLIAVGAGVIILLLAFRKRIREAISRNSQ